MLNVSISPICPWKRLLPYVCCKARPGDNLHVANKEEWMWRKEMEDMKDGQRVFKERA